MGWIKQRYIRRIKSRIYDYVVANYPKLEDDRFVLGDMPYNYKCHYNAVQKVLEGKADKVYACIAIHKRDWQDIIVHFINGTQKGKYQDNTWGWVHKHYDYYLVKEVKEDEYDNVVDILGGLKEMLIQLNSNAMLRKLLRIDSSII